MSSMVVFVGRCPGGGGGKFPVTFPVAGAGLMLIGGRNPSSGRVARRRRKAAKFYSESKRLSANCRTELSERSVNLRPIECLVNDVTATVSDLQSVEMIGARASGQRVGPTLSSRWQFGPG